MKPGRAEEILACEWGAKMSLGVAIGLAVVGEALGKLGVLAMAGLALVVAGLFIAVGLRLCRDREE